MFLRIIGLCKSGTLLLGEIINRSLGLRIGGEPDLSLASDFLYSVLENECFQLFFNR